MTGGVRLAAGVAVLSLLASGCGPDDPPPRPKRPQQQPMTPSPTPQEDDPGWDCHTMGNRHCGWLEAGA